MDWVRDEELDEIQRDFDRDDNYFFIARQRNQNGAGVLGFRLQGEVGVIRGWEPGVIPHENDIAIGTSLLDECFRVLMDQGAERAACTLRYPIASPRVAEWHITLFNQCGLKQWRPMGVQLILNLNDSQSHGSRPEGVQIVNRSEYSMDEMVDLIHRAFTSNQEDYDIHAFDAGVTEPDAIRQLHERIIDGHYGLSPVEAWKVAVIDGEPVGFAGSFIPENPYRPPHGVLGPVGVLPEYRRQGVSTLLISEVHSVLREHGCIYSYVGTPETNFGALEVYQRIGFKPLFKVARFRKVF